MMQKKINELLDTKVKTGMTRDQAIRWAAKSLELTINEVISITNGSPIPEPKPKRDRLEGFRDVRSAEQIRLGETEDEILKDIAGF